MEEEPNGSSSVSPWAAQRSWLRLHGLVHHTGVDVQAQPGQERRIRGSCNPHPTELIEPDREAVEGEPIVQRTSSRSLAKDGELLKGSSCRSSARGQEVSGARPMNDRR